MERRRRTIRPSVEGLEGRQLLSGAKGLEGRARAASAVTVTNTKVEYRLDDGAKVQVQLQGPGTLKGSTVVDGVLFLTFSATDTQSDIVGKVTGGSGRAPIASIRDSDIAIGSTTGLNGNLIDQLRLHQFDLIAGGRINILGGMNELTLNSVGPNTQVRLRDTPLNNSSITALADVTNNNNNSFNSSLTSIGTITTSNLGTRGVGTLEPVATGFGGPNVGAATGAIVIPGIGNGQNFPGTPGISQDAVRFGRTLTYSSDGQRGVVLSGIGGTFTPGTNLIEPRDASVPGGPVPPPGVVVNIKSIKGGPTAGTPPLGNAQVFGYDPAASLLIRFDAVTGAQLQSIAVPPSPNGLGGVTVAPIGNQLLALVGVGQQVLAFDALTGAPAGGFSTSNLAGLGIVNVTGLTFGEGLTTTLVDSTSGPTGTILSIDLARSLAAGQAVATGSPFSPNSEFVLSGGITSIPGSPSFFAQGGAHFNTFTPSTTQAGILAINPNGLNETSRTALESQGNFIPAGPDGAIAGNPSRAVGSIDAYLAIDVGVQNGQNVINLITPNGLNPVGSITLADANPLAGLSQSFHPELVNSALFDIQGNVQSFTAQTATGLVLNAAGNVDLVSIRRASNTSILGLPISHVDIPFRDNISIVSSKRLIIKGRNGVTINPNARQVGPLYLA